VTRERGANERLIQRWKALKRWGGKLIGYIWAVPWQPNEIKFEIQ